VKSLNQLLPVEIIPALQQVIASYLALAEADLYTALYDSDYQPSREAEVIEILESLKSIEETGKVDASLMNWIRNQMLSYFKKSGESETVNSFSRSRAIWRLAESITVRPSRCQFTHFFPFTVFHFLSME
jgi:hypothetical protein